MGIWKKTAALAVALACGGALMGCAMTVEEMYCLPRRSESYHNLQEAMDPVMAGLAYAAPTSGSNQQTVQSADLDGDGNEEILVFAKGNDENPLKIFVFRQEEEQYRLMARVESSGADFNQVEYAQLDGVPGLELIVGCRVSDQVLGNVTVYRFPQGQPEQMLTTQYRKFLICDLTEDQLGEMLVLTGGTQETEASIAVCYTIANGQVERSAEARLSQPVDHLKRITLGKLHGGQNAVFVASTVDANTIITDVFAMVDGVLTNVSLSSEAGTSVKTLRNYYVYADDIDQDGILELPSLISMTPEEDDVLQKEHMIRWYAMTPQGEEVDKLYTYHNYLEGWYLELTAQAAGRIQVTVQGTGTYQFDLQGTEDGKLTHLWTIFVLTGEERSAQAGEDNRFVLTKTDSVVYAGKLELGAMELGVTQELLQQAFHLIQSDWNTGEM